MSTLKILEYPHKVLRQVTPMLTTFDDSLRDTVKTMFDLMYADDGGCGLAAPQVGLSLRLFVMDCSPDQTQPYCFINPEIIEQSELADSQEGCLSFPGVYATVQRPRKVMVNYQDEFGKPQQLAAENLMAYCIHHEIEHLNGILYIDHLSKLKRDRLLKKYDKKARLASE